MSFLNLLAWLGAVGLAAPIWLHLRERPPRNVVTFSTLRFLEDQPRPKRQPLRLRDPLLLALRALALLLVVAGFAWPYFRKTSRVAVTESRVHVLDNTLSQRALAARGRAGDSFARSRAQLLEALSRSGPEVQDAVVEVTAQSRVVGGFGDPKDALRDRVAALSPSFERGSYLEAFRLASTLLAQSLGERKRILVYGDGQENQWSEHENAPPFLRGVDVALATAPEVERRPNLALGEPVVQRVFAGEKTLVDLVARLSHQGLARQARVVLTAGGREVLRKSLDLAGSSGTILLRAQWEDDPSQWVVGEMSVEGAPDDLAADDRAFFTLPPVEEGRVAVLARSPYLRAALSPDVMKGRWAARTVDPWRGEEPELQDAIVAEGSYLQSQRVRDLVLRHLTNGRGALLLVERETPLLTGFLRDLGFELLPARPEAAPPVAFRYVAGDHPVFRPFLSPDFGRLLDVRVRRYVPMKAAGGLPLLFADTGDGLVFEGVRTKGRLLVFAFGFARGQTTWPLDPTFVPFLDLCLQHVRQAGPVETSLLPGERHVMELPPDARPAEVVVRAGEEVVGRVPVEADGRVRLAVPRRPGLYTVSWGQDPAPQRVFAVNPSPKESVLRYVAEPPALAAWLVTDTDPREVTAAAPDVALEGARAAAGQRLWWWLLLLGAFTLAAETGWLMARKGAA